MWGFFLFVSAVLENSLGVTIVTLLRPFLLMQCLDLLYDLFSIFHSLIFQCFVLGIFL